MTDEASSKKGTSIALIVGLFALLAAAAYYSLHGEEKEVQLNTAESAVNYICLNDQSTFKLTPADFEKLAKANQITVVTGKKGASVMLVACPKCQKIEGVGALACEKDGTLYPDRLKDASPGKCPKCGYSIHPGA